MDEEIKQDFIRRKANENLTDSRGARILWSRHGIAELATEGWTRGMVEEGLRHCFVIEDYPISHRPLPDCLVLGWVPSGEPFHAVIGIDEIKDRLFIITVYKPALEEWHDDRRTRRR